MVQNTPTQEEALLIYLQNQINSTNAYIIRITDQIIRLNKSIEENEGREARFELVAMLEDEQSSLLNYMFRLDWLQNQLESYKEQIEFNEWKSNRK
jgi:hypothetical protein